MTRRPLVILLAVAACLPGGRAVAQAGGDWVPYRDAYRAMVVFEKYGGPKSLLQQQLQVRPRTPPPSAGGVELLVSGKTTQGHFPLDATLRTVFPLTRAPYDDNAVLQLSQPLGAFTVRPQVTLTLRPDNRYDSDELRHGCEQALAFARELALLGARRCTGVRFVFGKGAPAAPVAVQGGAPAQMASARGVPFAGDVGTDATFPVVTFRFSSAARVQLGTATAPLAIAPVFD
jgi:hypothetical protein